MTELVIVDCDATHARALSKSLGNLQPTLNIRTASTAAEAMELLQSRKVDLLLSELRATQPDGFELLEWALRQCPDTAIFAMSTANSEQLATRVAALGAVECFTKPVDPRLALQRFADLLSQSIRGQLQNVSLASLLQVLEMEQKTCRLSVESEDRQGTLVVRRGALVHAQCGDLSGQPAAVAIVAWTNAKIAISGHRGFEAPTIQQSLGFIVMEAMRLQDEAARGVRGTSEHSASAWPPPRRTWRPSAIPKESDRPPALGSPAKATGDSALPSGAQLLAVVDAETGTVLRHVAAQGCQLDELARMAAQVLRHELKALGLCDEPEGLEELVLSTTSRCDVIRPLGAREFALLVFAPEETNLVMARFELQQFIARMARADGDLADAREH